MLKDHTGSVNSIPFSSDGGQIFSRLGDESVLLPSYIREKTVDSTGLLTHTGWLLSPAGEGYLMFMPLAAPLPDSANILTIFHTPILPLLISLGPTSDLDGTIVIGH